MVSTTSGEPKAFQEVEDKMLTEAPSYRMVWYMYLLVVSTIIWKGILEGRCGSTKLSQSKGVTSVLGGDAFEMDRMSPYQGLYELTRKTWVVSNAPFEGVVGLTKYGII